MLTTINFRISENQKEELQKLADFKRLKISELLRVIIERHLENLRERGFDFHLQPNGVEYVCFDFDETHSNDDDIETIELD